MLLPFVFSVIQKGNTKKIQNRYISLLFHTLINLLTAGAVVIYLGLNEINCITALSALIDIILCSSCHNNGMLKKNTLILTRKRSRKNIIVILHFVECNILTTFLLLNNKIKREPGSLLLIEVSSGSEFFCLNKWLR